MCYIFYLWYNKRSKKMWCSKVWDVVKDNIANRNRPANDPYISTCGETLSITIKKVGETEQIKNFNRWMEAFKGWEESSICRVFALKEGGPELDLQGPHKENRTKTITTTKDVMVCVTPVLGRTGTDGFQGTESFARDSSRLSKA